MHEFYPKDYTDNESEVDDVFPVYTLSRHWKQELSLDKPENKSAKRARRTLRPARRSSGLHVLNPDPKFDDNLETQVVDVNMFLEAKLLYRPGGSQIIFTKKEKQMLTLEFRDYNAKESTSRYDQPEPDLALVVKYLGSYDKPAEVEVDRKVFKPEELHTYAIHLRQRATNVKLQCQTVENRNKVVKMWQGQHSSANDCLYNADYKKLKKLEMIAVNDVDCAVVRLHEHLSDAHFTTTEGLEVKATHQPCRLVMPYKAKIEPALDVGDRIVLFGIFKEDKKSSHKKLLSFGKTVVPWPDDVKYDKKTRIIIQRFKNQLVVYNHITPIFMSRKVDREHASGDLEVSRAFPVDGVWIERLKLP